MWAFRLWVSRLIEPKRKWDIGYIVTTLDNDRVLVVSDTKWDWNDKLCTHREMAMANLVVTTDGRVLKNRYGSPTK